MASANTGRYAVVAEDAPWHTVETTLMKTPLAFFIRILPRQRKISIDLMRHMSPQDAQNTSSPGMVF